MIEDHAAQAFKTFMRTVGVDTDASPDMIETPERVARMFQNELLVGYNIDIEGVFTVFEKGVYDQMVVQVDIPYYSLCRHHIIPFFGKVSIGYVPVEKIVGLSKLARVVNAFSRRLQTQENMTDEIADCLNTHLSPLGVVVVVSGQHLCMCMRGVESRGTVTYTTALRGVFRYNSSAKAEFLDICKLHRGDQAS